MTTHYYKKLMTTSYYKTNYWHPDTTNQIIDNKLLQKIY